MISYHSDKLSGRYDRKTYLIKPISNFKILIKYIVDHFMSDHISDFISEIVEGAALSRVL